MDKADNKIVGSTRFYRIDTVTNTLELGYTWYGKKYRGTGINKNCKYLLLEFAFDVLNAERVGFRANHLNKRSINAMKRIGCVEEGVLRNRSINGKGKRMDVIVLSIIKQEWVESVKQTLFNLSTTNC
ncbi:RimJ/RimL family protein N-acetyltransferase [Pedobacter cryoconitis]|uniref:RimJ/RimL family protein N-acetyltransferase n=1 Tax=Pedobacter cryoconitis TaxID=188932 RepID=A0A7W9E0R2_9SPHI|nr:RimJ/RimL family protein N-acetyltransferase [Pedobacter cryoconitis]